MDEDSDSGIWQRLGRLFHGGRSDSVEQAIIEASEEGELQKEEGSMLLRVLRLDELQVQDIMTPRTDIVAAEDSDTIEDGIKLIVETGHSRLPVYHDNRDNIVGIAYAKDMLIHAVTKDRINTTVSAVMRPAYFVPETKNVLELLQELRTRKNHMAVILDEYGGTSGLVTIEDIIEEIVGDIEDEHDAPKEQDVLSTGEGVWELSGRAFLDDVNETLDLELESDEVDTIGGYLSQLAGRVPEKGEAFDMQGVRFTVEDADAKQIRRILATLLDNSVNGVPEADESRQADTSDHKAAG